MTGVFLSVLKTAKVVPVFQKDSKIDYTNYRPKNIERILEKPIYKRLYTFLNNNNIIYNLQFGFRQQYSISHALINITENIRKALDDRNIVSQEVSQWLHIPNDYALQKNLFTS